MDAMFDIDTVPLWLLGLLLFLALSVAREIGQALDERRRARLDPDAKDQAMTTSR